MRTHICLALFVMFACTMLEAQQAKIGGTGGAGGISGFQTSNARLVITTNSLPNATANVSYSQTLTSVNGVTPLTWTILFGSLPPGMVLNSSTGAITGTSADPGNYLFTVMVTDSKSPTAQTATKDLSIAVSCPTLLIMSPLTLPPGTNGVAYSYQFLAQGGLGPVTWTQTGTWQTGLTLSSSGLLSGTPTVASTVQVQVTATDSCPVSTQQASNTFTLAINSPLVINTSTTLPAGVSGTAYSTSFSASGGTGPYTWAVTSGSLPAGLALSSSGNLNGTPTTSGTSQFTVTVTDSVGNSNSGVFTLTIGCTVLSITTTTLAAGTQGSPYSAQLQKSGGTGTVTWTISAGALPTGLSMNINGLISGTPSLPNTYDFTVQATDACTVPQVVTQDLSITINGALQIITTSPLPPATEGSLYTVTLAAKGGTSPYVWTVPGGPIQSGAIDVVTDYAAMRLPDRNSFHLSQTGLAKYFVINNSLLWWIKNSAGNPWDGEMFDGSFIYQWFTEGPTWGNASGYKKYRTPVPLWPRYFVLGSDIVTYTPGPNLYDITESCGTDNLAPIDNLGVRGELTGPFSEDIGGNIGTVQYLLATKWIKCSANAATSCNNREQYWLGQGIGQYRWQSAHLSGGVFVIDQTSLENNKVAGGAPTPNFACKVPNPPVQNTLPPGITTTSSTTLNLVDSTGVIIGTPSTAGTSAFTVQVEDAVGNITQANMTLAVSCPAFSITSTSPLPKATAGQAYNFQLLSSGGIAPVLWTTSGALPTGLTLSSGGLISGTPTQTGIFSVPIIAKDSCNPNVQSQLKTFSLTVAANSGPLAITTTSPLQGATEGTAYSQQMAAQGGTPPYSWAITAGTLPAGLSMSATGAITGTPTTTGVSSVTIQVTDSILGTASGSFSITVSCPSLALVTTSPLPNGVQGTAYSLQFQATGGITPYSWTLTGGTLPTGITLASSGLLSGTPTANGSFSPVVQVADSCVATPQTASNTFSLTIAPTPVPLSITTTSPLPSGTQGVAYSTSLAATGGTQPYFWSVISGSLPTGLSLASNGTISGTPTTIGVYAATIRVTDNVGATASGSFQITISCPSLAITSSTTLPQGTQSSLYSFQLTNSGGISPFTWTLTGGTLPSGVSLATSGLISGTPTASGTFNPQIQVADACSTPQTASNTFTLVIKPATVPLTITTTSPLPSATQNVAYSATMSAVGGTAPYTWAVTAGTLPTGLSLSSAGVISGTPTTAGSATVTIQVTDNVAATASGSFTITVNAQSGADNTYCTSTNTWIGPTTDGVATLPNRCFNTALANTPASGPVKTVCSSGCDYTTIQAAVNAATCGWIIKIKSTSTGTPSGTQLSYSGQVTIPATACTASNWIIVETDQIAASGMAPEGTRITPAYAGIPSLPGRPAYGQPTTAGIYLPKLINNGRVINCTANASHWRFIGLEVTTTTGTSTADAITCTTVNNFIWDRILIHAGNSATWQSRDNVTRAWDVPQNQYLAIIDSFCGDFHNTAPGSNCFLLGGTTSTVTEGPTKIVNNFIEAADSSSALGGGGNGTATLVPCDFEWRRNHMFKPLFWKTNDPTYFGTKFVVKNHIDWKNACRALIEGNIMENAWGQQSDQPGPLAEWGAKNQSSFTSGTASSNGTGTLTAISGTFPASVVSPNCATPTHCLVKYNGLNYLAQTRVDNMHITVKSSSGTVPPTTSSASYQAYAPGLNPNAQVSDITVRYNYFRHGSRCLEIFSAPSDAGDIAKFTGRFEIHDNVCDDIDGFKWNLSTGACCAWSIGLYISNSFPSPNYMDQIDIHKNTILPFLTGGSKGDGPSLGFVAQTSTTGWIGHFKIYDNIAAAGLGLATLGVCTTPKTGLSDMQCMDKINGVAQNTFCFDHNALATTTQGTVNGTANNPPYPAAGQSPGCGFTTTGNQLPASYAAIGFTGLNGANGGNYQLQLTSPFHNAASDGTDMGVNWSVFQSKIAGVQ